MKKIYFMSDSHLGVPDSQSSMQRERMLVQWLERVSADASDIFLLGDIFDFWFEYSTVVPRGFVRLLGKLADIVEKGIQVHYFTGNHDMWAFGYFESELGLRIYRQPLEIMLQGKRCYIGHGDGLGPGDHVYKLQKRIFKSRISQKLFSLIHPGFGTRLALFLSKKSRQSHSQDEAHLMGEDKESLIAYSKGILAIRHVDFFIFGHRHYPVMLDIGQNSHFVNTGDWITKFSYAVLSGGKMELRYFGEEE